MQRPFSSNQVQDNKCSNQLQDNKCSNQVEKEHMSRRRRQLEHAGQTQGERVTSRAMTCRAASTGEADDTP